MHTCEKVKGEELYILPDVEFVCLPYMNTQGWFKNAFLGGFCFPSEKTIFIRESRTWDKKLLCHERGHLRGLKHTWKPGYLMFPYMIGRGWKE